MMKRGMMKSRKLKGDYRCTTARKKPDDDDDDDDGIMFVKLAHVQRICQ